MASYYALRKQRELCPDINAYSVFVVDEIPSQSIIDDDGNRDYVSSEAEIEATRAMQSVEFFPWPDKRCIVINLGFLDYEYNFLIRDDVADPAVLYGYTQRRDGNTTAPHDYRVMTNVFRSRLIGVDQTPTLEWACRLDRYIVAMWETYEADHPCLLDVATLDELRERMWNWKNHRGEVIDFDDSWIEWMVPGGHRWLLYIPDLLERGTGHGAAEYMGADLCHTFAALVCPTGYAVRTRLGEFGPQRFQSQWGDRPILAFIRADRLFRLYRMDASREINHRSPRPHGRRGHYAHLWRKAGIHHEDVPVDLAGRLTLIRERRVRRVWKPECWVGPHLFDVDGMGLEIINREFDLPPL